MSRSPRPGAAARGASDRRTIAKNRRATFEFFILERIEAGVALTGTEVKSLRESRADLSGAFVRIEKGEAYLVGCNIAEYSFGNRMNHVPLRPRKLLLHAREIRELDKKVKTEGVTVIPVELYFKGAYAKVEIALAKGKKLHDKREDIARRDARREMDRGMRRRR